MATPYTKLDGVNYRIQAGLPTGGVDTLQFTDSASSFTQTLPAATGTLALTTIATGANAVATTDMAAAFRALDGLVMPNVLGYLVNTPPGSPADGYTAIIGAAPTGLWAGQGGKVTRWSASLAAYEFYTPKDGWMLQSNSGRETYRRTGSAWEIFYQEGTWSPTPTSLGGSGITFPTAKYTRIGNRWDFALKIIGTGMTATANATTVTLPASPSVVASFSSVNDSVGSYGTGLIYTSGVIYLPTVSSTVSIISSGTFFS